MTLLREGQPNDALPWLKRAVELEPANATFRGDSWPSCTWSARTRARPSRISSSALALSEEERPGVHLSLGWALQEEGRLAEAREHYETALRIQPDSAAAQLNIGGLSEEQGRMDEAEAAFRTALRVQPNFPIPHARLATLLRGKLPDEDLAALEARLADPELPQGPRARLLFGLAHVLDARGEYARAGECLREANAISK